MRVGVGCLLLVWSAAHCAHAARPEVVIDPGGVPPGALQAITGAVDAITRLAEDQDGGEVSRLRRRARDATLSALETQGYYAPKVTLEVGEDIGGETWDITIEPGERTQVDDVSLHFKGQIARPEFAGRVQILKEQWPLQQGMPFINESWHNAKTSLLDDVSRKDFYFARLLNTQATVDAETSKADLFVEVASGPRVRLGKLSTSGLKRVPRKLIERYVQYKPGDPYDQDKLDEWQQALQSTSFFRGAFVTLDQDESAQRVLPGDELELPVHVKVSEAPARRVTSSLGVDSDHGVRVEGLYRQNVVFGKPVWIETGAGVDKDNQRAFFDVHLPPTTRGYKDSVGVLYEHSDVEGLDNRRVGAAWKRRQERKAGDGSRVEYETQLGLGVAYDKTRIRGADDYEVPSAVTTWQWLRRDVDKKYDPREGNLVDFGVGAGITLDKSEPFYRSSLRVQQWWPIGRRDVLTVRGEIGKVWSDTDRLPQDFGYRTGGARTIRGYRYQSIGLDRGDAVIGAPALAVASIEYTHYFTEMIGMNYFIDVGDATTSFGEMDPALGYGLGVAIRTPAGPFHVDLAYGQRDRRLRLHFSLGIAF
ncbi:BamA/TamA family outer membrane protein [Pusillimonas sp. SM2304]|uniref:autotransporter assembly complex protein TamA n=1 Tax=Pusillimonas sp. SM2304 TaxID=3073241 RepID=UPI002876ADE2|nr:BamA/TamA family outer membrane protein [Pusillimonas sp. SM2304]MDS1138841.1 BamA/TamA family outer membrane protein [Pusillimonas sp. SM2304]